VPLKVTLVVFVRLFPRIVTATHLAGGGYCLHEGAEPHR